MWLHVDPRSPQPMYQQVAEGIKAAVAKGILEPGNKLPSVRELSMELTLNHNTITKAYQDLEREGVIEVLRGRGTFIAERPQPSNVAARRNQLERNLERLLVEALHLQMTEADLLDLMKNVAARWRTGKEEEQ